VYRIDFHGALSKEARRGGRCDGKIDRPARAIARSDALRLIPARAGVAGEHRPMFATSAEKKERARARAVHGSEASEREGERDGQSCSR